MPTSTLTKGWNTLFQNAEAVTDSEVDLTDFQDRLILKSKRTGFDLTEEAKEDWLECDEGDPGMQLMTEEQIIAEVIHSGESGSSDEEVDDSIPPT